MTPTNASSPRPYRNPERPHVVPDLRGDPETLVRELYQMRAAETKRLVGLTLAAAIATTNYRRAGRTLAG